MKKADVILSARTFVDSVTNARDWIPCEDLLNDDYVFRYCGTYMSIQPSGKYYTFFTTNQTVKDEKNDQLFWDTVINLLPEYEFYSGEGDPCDCFAMKHK